MGARFNERRATPRHGRDATARQGRDATARRSRDAFTLIELLVVMGIMAVLAGITAASYVGVTRRASREGARDNVMGVLRQARVSAVDTGRGAVVRIEPADHTLYGISSTVIGAWHFDDLNGTTTPGAQNYDGTVNGAVSAPGKLGLALRFNLNADGTYNAGSTDYVDCGSASIWAQTTGVRLEAWVNPGPAGAGVTGPIMAMESITGGLRGYFMAADYNGDGTVNFEGGFAVSGATLGPYGPGAVVVKSSQAYDCGRWHSVAVEFDGFQARLFVDGALIASDASDGTDGFGGTVGNGVASAQWNSPARMVPAFGQPLYVGRGLNMAGGAAYFAGVIDEPRVISIGGGTPVTVPERVPIVTNAEVIHYDAQGFLDQAYHLGPVYVALGDPYESADLSADISAAATSLNVQPNDPFPPNGGLILIGDEVIAYDSGGLLTRGQYGTVAAPHNAGDKVYFARVVKISPTGLVTRP